MSIKKHALAFNLVMADGVDPVNNFTMAVTNDGENQANIKISGANVTNEVAENLVLHSPELSAIVLSLAAAINAKQNPTT